MTVELIRLSLAVFGFQFVVFWLVDFTPWPVIHSRTPLFVLQRLMVGAGCIMTAIPVPDVDQTPPPAYVFDGGASGVHGDAHARTRLPDSGRGAVRHLKP
ncbi:MAG: hypothetical protein V5A34_11415 [Halapricum sp.]